MSEQKQSKKLAIKDLLIRKSKYAGYGICNSKGLCKLNIRKGKTPGCI